MFQRLKNCQCLFRFPFNSQVLSQAATLQMIILRQLHVTHVARPKFKTLINMCLIWINRTASYTIRLITWEPSVIYNYPPILSGSLLRNSSWSMKFKIASQTVHMHTLIWVSAGCLYQNEHLCKKRLILWISVGKLNRFLSKFNIVYKNVIWI